MTAHVPQARRQAVPLRRRPPLAQHSQAQRALLQAGKWPLCRPRLPSPQPIVHTIAFYQNGIFTVDSGADL